MPIDGEPPEIDGRLTEAIWQQAPAATGFVQRQPDEGAPASLPTEVRFLLAPDALYVGARMASDDPASIQAPISRRDNDAEADVLLVSLDTYRDRRTAYTFGITAGGVRIDRFHPEDRESADASFDPVWEARAHVGPDGWTAEMRIPYSQLRFLDQPEQSWGLNVVRFVPARNERSMWVLVPRQETGWSSRFGELTGIRGLRQGRRIELLPYAAGDAQRLGTPQPDNPFFEEEDLQGRVGADFKMGLGSSFTLEGTVNPDFGQVEADPAVVNLSAFEIFFPERRPFFTERAQLLRGSGPAYFYSRRIGAPPVGRIDADYADVPEETAILGAAKLTGRLASGTSLGGLFAVTDREHARTWDAATGAFGRQLLSPYSGFLVLRAQQEVGRSASTVGASFTGVVRDLDAAEPATDLLTEEAWAGGLDWLLRLADDIYELSGHAGFSQVAGSEAAILRLQRSSARYFQRPDADHVELDPLRTSLSGYTGRLALDKVSGKHWLWTTALSAYSPELEINDAGRLATTDYVFGYGNLRYRQTEPGPLLRDYQVGLSSENQYNFDGTRTFTALRTDSELTWKSFWTTAFTGWVDLRSQSDRSTRGGPLMGTGQAWVTWLSFASNPGRSTRGSGSVFYGENELGERTVELSGGVSFRPSPRWQLVLEPVWFDSTQPRQFVTSRENGPSATYGRRYVFSFIDRHEVALRTRLNLAVTPDLSFELYAEPFAASGDFYRFGELPAAGSRDLRFYGTDGTTAEEREDGSLLVTDGADSFVLPDRDFDLRSFRSNAVLRWEWRPGSTLFLVWQQDRFGELTRGESVRPDALADVFDPAADQRFVVKVSYWIPWG
ncbi:MAG TPA: DUF5916 domain-containing protein [Thermoanaerobaculia bacterium]|nr:DUF5916 domain-containing protein [Thermoanaerobaculia bacterium]